MHVFKFITIGTDEEPKAPLVTRIYIAAGSTSGVLIACILLMVVISVVVCHFKCRNKAFNLTSNVAYTGRRTNEDIDLDYYAVSGQPLAVGSAIDRVKMKDHSGSNSSPYQISAVQLCTANGNSTTADLDARQLCDGKRSNLDLVQNIAYKSTTAPISSNTGIQDVHHSAEDQEEYYDYIL